MNEVNHIAIIMDGNGRWAEQRGESRSFGHQEGAKTVRKITIAAAKKGVKFLTLYAFSTENWKRPKTEVSFLMNLLKKFLKNELNTLMQNNIRFFAIGDLSVFDKSLQETIEDVERKTKDNSGLTQILALNYGSLDEITRACKKTVQNELEITQENIEKHLDTANISPVDILIRTGGERRLSNFLLWQSSYAELFFTDTLWPDFEEDEFNSIIEKFLHTKRKFGGL